MGAVTQFLISLGEMANKQFQEHKDEYEVSLRKYLELLEEYQNEKKRYDKEEQAYEEALNNYLKKLEQCKQCPVKPIPPKCPARPIPPKETFVCMGPNMENSKRLVYTRDNITKPFNENHRIQFTLNGEALDEGVNQIIEKNLTLGFDFLFKMPNKETLDIFGIQDNHQIGAKKMYDAFEKEVSETCKGEIEILERMQLPIEPGFLRISCKESKIDGKIVDTNSFLEALAKKGFKLQLDGENATFEKIVSYTLSKKLNENTLKIIEKSATKKITMKKTGYIGQAASNQ